MIRKADLHIHTTTSGDALNTQEVRIITTQKKSDFRLRNIVDKEESECLNLH